MVARTLGVASEYSRIPNIHRAARALSFLTRPEADRGIKLGRNESPVTARTNVLDAEHLPRVGTAVAESYFTRQQLGFLAGVTFLRDGLQMLNAVMQKGPAVELEDTTKPFGKEEVPEYDDWGSKGSCLWANDNTPTKKTVLRIGWFLHDKVMLMPSQVFTTVDETVGTLITRGRVKLAPQAALQYLADHPEARVMELAMKYGMGRRINRFGYTHYSWAIKHDGLGYERTARPEQDQAIRVNLKGHPTYDVTDIAFTATHPAGNGFFLISEERHECRLFFLPNELAYLKVTTAKDLEIDFD